MGFFEDFLQQNQNNPLIQRLVQHIAAQVDPYQQTAALAQQGQLPLAALKGVQTVVTTAPKLAADTAGLGMEGFANFGKAGLGSMLAGLAPYADQIPGLSSNDKAVLAALAAPNRADLLGTLQHDIANTDYVRANADTPLAWGTGAAALGLDLSNFLPFSKVEAPLKVAVKPAGQAVLRAVKGEAPGVLAKVGALAPEALAQVPRQLLPQGVADLAPQAAAKIAATTPQAAPAVEQAVAKLTGAAPAAPVVATSKFTPEQLAAIGADPRVQALQQTIADIKASVDPTATQISGQTGGTVKTLGSRLKGPQLRLSQLQQEIAAGVTPAAPPAAGPLRTIFGQDASVIHSGTYPGKAQAVAAPDVQQAVARLVGETPVSKQEAAALAPDASVNDKLNALEQNPSLPVQIGTPQSANDLAAALKSAYGDNAFARKNAVPKLTRDLGVRLQSDGTFVKNGVDVTAPILDYLNGRGAMGNDRKAIAAAFDYTKGAVDDLAGGRAAPVSDVAAQAAGNVDQPMLPPNRGLPGVLGDYAGQLEAELAQGKAKYRAGTPEQRRAWKPQIDAMENLTRAAREEASNGNISPVNPLTNPNLGLAAGLNVPASVYLRGGGALAGGSIGALQSNNDPTTILTGALAGAAGGAGLEKVATNQTLRDLALIGNEAGVKGMQDALQGGKFTLKGVAHDWSADKTKTVRGLALDTMTNYVRALVNKIPLADIRASRADLIQQAKQAGTTNNASHPYTSMTANLFDQLGQDVTKYDLHQAYGQGYLGSADKVQTPLHPLASAAAGAGYSLANPVTYLTSGLGTAVAAARGAARPYTNAAFNAVNDLEHNAARDAGFRLAVQQQLGQIAPAFLEQVKAAGGDIKSLSTDGIFSPAQAEAALPGGGAVWQHVLDQVLGTPAQQAVKANAKQGIAAVAAAPQQDGLAAQFVKQAFGDYSTRSGVAKALGAVAPFSRYTLGQLPVLSTLVAGHPAATLLVAKMLKDAGQRAAATGTPSYNADNLAVPNGTPVLGGLAGLEAGGAPASGSINLLNSFSPVNVDIGSLGDITDPNKSAYEKAVALMGAVGLQPNPLIQTAAYALGGTDIAPGAQSRFSGLENSLGGPTLPTLKAPLDALRKALGNSPSNYDPYQVAAAEIVLQQTGQPISDPANHALAVQTLDPNSPLMQQARQRVDQGNAVKNLVSGLSPVSLTTTTDTKAQYRQAKANDPRYTKAQIAQAATVNPQIAAQMQAVNAQIEAQNPALVTYAPPKLTAQDKQDPRLTAWEQRNVGLKNVNPGLYVQMRAAFKQQIGVK